MRASSSHAACGREETGAGEAGARRGATELEIAREKMGRHGGRIVGEAGRDGAGGMGGRGWEGLQGGREIEGGSGAGCSAVLRRAWVVGGVGRFGDSSADRAAVL